MRALVEGFPFKWQAEIINKCHFTPKYWIAHDTGQTHLIPDGVVFHNAEDAYSGNPCKELTNSKIAYVPDSFYKDNVELLNVTLKMMYLRRGAYKKMLSKKMFSKIFTSDNHVRRFLYKEISYWDYVLDSYGIELVIIESMPHIHYHYIIYYLAQKKDVKVVFFHGAPGNHTMRFFLCETMDELTPSGNISELSGENADKFTIERINKMPAYAIYDAAHPWANKISFKGLHKRLFQKANDPINLAKWAVGGSLRILGSVFQNLQSLPYSLEYLLTSTSDIPGKPFVYFPLHVRPEYSSYPVGGNFEDPVYCCEYLSQLLPEGFLIVVKEHPNQRYGTESNAYFWQYHELLNIHNVVLVRKSISSFDLIKKSRAVAVVTGHSGWEGLTNNKPVIKFGHPWYDKCPYVYHVDTLRENVDMLKKDFIFDPVKVDEYYKEFIQATHPGTTNLVAIPSIDISMDNNIASVVDAINKKIDAW